MEFETRRLSIKKFIPEYMQVMYDTWGCDADVGMYISGFRIDWNYDDFAEYVLKTYMDVNHTRCIIQDKKSNEIIGNISIYLEDSKSKSVNIWLLKDYWNKGLGTEALKGIIRELKKEKLNSLYATTDKRNAGATRMLEKCGFELIDSIPEAREDLEGELGTECLFELEFKR